MKLTPAARIFLERIATKSEEEQKKALTSLSKKVQGLAAIVGNLAETAQETPFVGQAKALEITSRLKMEGAGPRLEKDTGDFYTYMEFRAHAVKLLEQHTTPQQTMLTLE